MKTSDVKIMTGLAAMLLAAACAVGADTSSAIASTNDITNLPSYTLHKGDLVLVNVGIWPYFSANGLTDPNSMFPDTMMITAAGEDRGDCRTQFVLGQLICVNYRFRCMAALPGTPVTDRGQVYLVDVNAEALAKPDDPKGTCYALQVMSTNGTSSLRLAAFVAAEKRLYAQDIQATRGLIEFLTGGSAALQQGSAGITFAFQFNPRPTDPQTFTLAGYDPSIQVKQAFTTSINSEGYPNPQAGSIAKVSCSPAK